jgi:hypothetical protein
MLVGLSEGKRPLAIRRRKIQDNIKMVIGKQRWSFCTVFIRLRTGTGGGSLSTE